VPEAARRVDAAVVEVGDSGRVDVQGEGKRVEDEAVLELGDEGGFPVEALDLPGAEGEGREGDESCVFGGACQFRVCLVF